MLHSDCHALVFLDVFTLVTYCTLSSALVWPLVHKAFLIIEKYIYYGALPPGLFMLGLVQHQLVVT